MTEDGQSKLPLQPDQLRQATTLRDTNRSGSLEMKGHSTALDQATVVNIPGLDR